MNPVQKTTYHSVIVWVNVNANRMSKGKNATNASQVILIHTLLLATDVIGIALCAGVFLFQRYKSKKAKLSAA